MRQIIDLTSEGKDAVEMLVWKWHEGKQELAERAFDSSSYLVQPTELETGHAAAKAGIFFEVPFPDYEAADVAQIGHFHVTLVCLFLLSS